MSAPRVKNAATSDDAIAAPDSRRPPRSAEPARPLDPKLRPFAQALADLLLADLLKYPPKP